EREEILDHRIAAEAEIGASQMFGDVWMQLRHSLDVAFVDDGAMPRNAKRSVFLPGECGIDHHALRDAAGAVVRIGLEGLGIRADAVREERVAPANRAGYCLGVRVDQQLRRIEAIADWRIVRAVHTIPIELARPNVGEIAMPDLIGALAQADLVGLDPVVFAVEETQLHRRRVLGEEGEVATLAVPRGSEWVGFAWPDAHWVVVDRVGVVNGIRLQARGRPGNAQLDV